MSRTIVLAGTAFLLIIFLMANLMAGQSRGTPRPANPPPQPPQPIGPLSIAQVIEAFYSLGVTRTEDLVSRNKVRFQATPEIIEILKELGATERLLSSIPPPAPPPVVEPRVAGPLLVQCDPADCAVVVNEHYYGSTDTRKKTVSKLPPGNTTIEVFSAGYEPQTQKVVMLEGQPAEARFLLTLTAETRQVKGQQLLWDAMRALGGLEMVSLLWEYQGDGILEWRDGTGTVQQGSMKFTKNPGQDIELEFRTRDGSCTSSISGRTTKQACRGALRNAENIANEAAASFLLYEIRNVMSDVLKETATLSTDGAQRIETSVGGEPYVLTLDEDKRPVELVHTRRGRLASIVRVTYGNYVKLNEGVYPSLLELRQDDNLVLAFKMKGLSTRVVK